MKLIYSEASFQILADSLNFLTKKYDCHILAYVMMPNHIHLILYFPAQNHLSAFMRDFKKFTSVKLRQELERNNISLEPLRYESRQQKFKVWMDRFDDVCIKSKEVFQSKFDYIHNNPLQEHWKLARHVEEYKYSSAGFTRVDRMGL